MINPFTHVGKVVSDAYASAGRSDCAPGQAKIAVTLGLPIIVPVSFITAFFKKKEGAPQQ